MRALNTAVATTISLLITGAVIADDKTGRYVEATFGLNTLADTDYDVFLDGTSGSGEASFDGSFGAGGAVGYRFDNGFSIEGEYLYRRVELDSVDLGAVGVFSDGDFANTQINVNGFYHLEDLFDSAIEPYVGVGLAYITEIDSDLEQNSEELEFESDEFALEVMAGARYQVLERGFIDVGIRYLALGGVTLESTANSADTIDADYNPLMVTASFGWKF